MNAFAQRRRREVKEARMKEMWRSIFARLFVDDGPVKVAIDEDELLSDLNYGRD